MLDIRFFQNLWKRSEILTKQIFSKNFYKPLPRPPLDFPGREGGGVPQGIYNIWCFFCLAGLWEGGSQLKIWLYFLFSKYLFYLNILETCGRQEKVSSIRKVLLDVFSENKKNHFKVCWIKPFLSGLDHIPILWARTAGTGQGCIRNKCECCLVLLWKQYSLNYILDIVGPWILAARVCLLQQKSRKLAKPCGTQSLIIIMWFSFSSLVLFTDSPSRLLQSSICSVSESVSVCLCHWWGCWYFFATSVCIVYYYSLQTWIPIGTM